MRFQSLSLTTPSANVAGAAPATPPDYCFPCNVRYDYSGGGLAGLITIDGVMLLDGYRVFVVDSSSAVNSGIYSATSGAWYRSQDMAAGDDAAGDRFTVTQGTTYAGTNWLCTASPAIVGTNTLTFAAA